MKETEKNVSLLRYVVYLGLMLFVVFGLVFMLSSCEKDDLPDGDAPLGEFVPVSINLQGISEGGSEDVTRSAAAFAPVTETVSLGDGMLMEMSLEADPAAELRADSSALAEGVKFLLIAVKVTGDANNNKYVSHAEYTIVDGVPSLIGSDSVHVPGGGDYKFMCVSFNNSTSLLTPDDYSGGSLHTDSVSIFRNLPNNVDLLYWSQTVNNVSERQVLPVTLRHQFNFVKVKVDCSYNGWNISQINADNIRLKTYNAFTLDADGDVTAGTETVRPVSWPSILTANPIQESIGDTVYLSTLDIYLGAQALTLSIGTTTPSAATTFTFSSATFAAGDGKSYVLTLKIRQPMFASSNIYWDADSARLTFDGYMENPASQNKYQGVYFKFGSLVGISSALSDDSTTFAGGTIGTPSTGTPIYVWSSAGSTWIQTNVATASDSSFVGFTPGAANGETGSDAWDRIPYTGGTPAQTKNRNDRYVINLVDSFAFMKGDICRYLQQKGHAPAPPAGKTQWRLPTSNEFGTTNSSIFWDETTVKNGWKRLGGASWTSNNTNNLADGKYAGIPTGGYFGAAANFFPASGCRDAGGPLRSAGSNGYYWSGSVYDATYGYHLYFYSSLARPYYYGSVNRRYGFAVRCVLQE
jgi:hypothetical protein